MSSVGVSTVQLDNVTRDLVQLRLAVEQLNQLAGGNASLASIVTSSGSRRVIVASSASPEAGPG